LSVSGKLPVTLVLAWLLASCATTPPVPAFSYNEVVIVNRLRVAVQNVTLQAAETNRVFSCGNIAPRGICSNKFPERPYYGDPIRVSWQVAGGRGYNRQIGLQLPESFKPELPLRGVLVIAAQGSLSAFLEQEVPGPHY
jgi:hypothetical protein